RLGDAHVAADALADLVHTALADLLRQVGIGDRGTRGADQIPDAAAHDRRHQVGIGEAGDPHDRPRRRLAPPARHPHLAPPPPAETRAGPEPSDPPATEPTVTSHRPTRSPASDTNSSPSSRSTPSAPILSTATRHATAHSSPTASRTASSISSQNRARLRSEP